MATVVTLMEQMLKGEKISVSNLANITNGEIGVEHLVVPTVVTFGVPRDVTAIRKRGSVMSRSRVNEKLGATQAGRMGPKIILAAIMLFRVTMTMTLTTTVVTIVQCGVMVPAVSYISNTSLYNANRLLRSVNVRKLKCNKTLVSTVVVSERGTTYTR